MMNPVTSVSVAGYTIDRGNRETLVVPNDFCALAAAEVKSKTALKSD
jgi:hypothetical protein